MKIGILTSSRADYGIYLPLLKALYGDSFFKPEIIAFGTHLSPAFGNTVKAIEEDGFLVPHKIDTIPNGDQPENISYAIGKTVINFSSFWKDNQFDLVFALGDRYEMFAAVISSVPFNVKIAHIHGGETTSGAIDDAFRHSITHMSFIHFTSAAPYANRVKELIGSFNHVYNVGALSFDNLKNITLYSIAEFRDKFGVDLTKPTILITFHPETIDFEKNRAYAAELVAALNQTKGFQFLITMPNSDTMGNIIRTSLQGFIERNTNAFGFENLGMIGYLSAMKHCIVMIGNTSSGCIEANWFPKWVINLGNRQKGRIETPNRINCEIKKEMIAEKLALIKQASIPEHTDIYGHGNSAFKIVQIIKQNYA
ncbi:MAG: UDP-N-acetylglucosamine 2-epimerase [Bacteroidota bacterium]|nr:UDP-N-acetylglucosamine 2-epimerase [Bacteroidota bacterium]